ncbi:TPA: hypothetical protein ACPKAL_003692 [Vibrio alginolyticus]|uniref:hypothetical protein n=1 Tax=Vibrio harveyi group TaxID=717610 RepID=UPI00063D99DC|nr:MULTISPECIES: hypothetical protein [Vibrio harveyi group]ELJ1804445.1 hypothetical protein [Vibrio parahaemolyticus]KLI71156.1 hypothetical protein AAW26_16700 [Vibrio alginolyticus]MCF9665111.1 hypothetical protein [Vibrio parahaemolyticus]MCQ9070875.1 hypothetical protein [Vibrio alginolyticus]MDM4739646.1 hypothetical protein [Vibrio alginolyticus]
MALTREEQAVRDRLLNCRKQHYSIPKEDLITIRNMIRNNAVSKKAVCLLFGITYADLKNQLKSLSG